MFISPPSLPKHTNMRLSTHDYLGCVSGCVVLGLQVPDQDVNRLGGRSGIVSGCRGEPCSAPAGPLEWMRHPMSSPGRPRGGWEGRMGRPPRPGRGFLLVKCLNILRHDQGINAARLPDPYGPSGSGSGSGASFKPNGHSGRGGGPALKLEIIILE